MKIDIDGELPGVYQYHTVSDDRATGRFEMTLFKNKIDLNQSKNGHLIYSKAETGQFPWKTESDYSKVIKQIKSWVSK